MSSPHTLTPREVRQLLHHIFHTNMHLALTGQARLSPCLWGPPGIGKTALVEALAQELDWPLIHIAPAQFEEMGDLIGMPAIEGTHTVLRPPAWIPQETGPGILLLDDFNRADDRILRGLMPLWQRHELLSWRLPEKWQLVLTANPDQGDYSVTPLDDAMHNRLIHLHMRFDLDSWVAWARAHHIDSRAIRFVRTWPTLVQRPPTTPRSLVQFFQLAAKLPDWQQDEKMLYQLACACLDTHTADKLIQFVRMGIDQWPSPEVWFTQADSPALHQILQKIDRPEWQLDALAGWLDEAWHWLHQQASRLSPVAIQRLAHLLTNPMLPQGLRQSFAIRLTQIDQPNIQQVLALPEVAPLLLG